MKKTSMNSKLNILYHMLKLLNIYSLIVITQCCFVFSQKMTCNNETFIRLDNFANKFMIFGDTTKFPESVDELIPHCR